MADPSLLITRVAAATLLPAGFERMGRSQCFTEDRGWFTILVEFLPEKGRRGAHIEVGASLHWSGEGGLGYDLSERISDFATLETEQQLADGVRPMVELARSRGEALRASLSAITTARGSIVAHEFLSDALWGHFHRGVVSALADDVSAARSYFGAMIEEPSTAAWALRLKKRARTLSGLASHRARFDDAVRELVTRSRAAKKLPPMAWSFPG